MNIRRLAFCLTFAPMIILMGIAMLAIFPLFLFVYWMFGGTGGSPWEEAWECVSEASINMMKDGWDATEK